MLMLESDAHMLCEQDDCVTNLTFYYVLMKNADYVGWRSEMRSYAQLQSAVLENIQD